MLPIPWKYVQDWNCNGCGRCCNGYDVVLDFPEWMKIVKDYGIGFTEPSITKFFLKRKSDGSCIFLSNLYNRGFCTLQHAKPVACKLWPFKISDKPKYGKPNEAVYNYGEMKLYVYVDPACVGLRWGNPSASFVNETLTEFVDIALGMRRKQVYSTSSLLRPQPWKLI